MLPFPTVLLRLGVALLLGTLIGWEREGHDHAAGMRTNALVAVGCAFFTILSGYAFHDMLETQHIQLDPTRIASYVVAGIGFLGGGSIFIARDRSRVKGMTTAAAIWVVAAIGMGCGAGMLWEAILTTGITLMVLIAMRYLESSRLMGFDVMEYDLDLMVNAVGDQRALVSRIHDICMVHKVELKALAIQEREEQYYIQFSCEAPSTVHLAKTVDKLRQLPHVNEIQFSLGGEEKPKHVQANMRP
ncbi:MgtC/SapB family protein [Ktedonospora formicarum]|nr:MgtC/SapB family protein [Ktedonospora formicarum]